MAKNWYTVIDYTLCAECGICVEKCPKGAISYMGDYTGWTPPNLVDNDNTQPSQCCDAGGCCCG